MTKHDIADAIEMYASVNYGNTIPFIEAVRLCNNDALRILYKFLMQPREDYDNELTLSLNRFGADYVKAEFHTRGLMFPEIRL